jgi:uncharacterized membrane protein YgcG
MTSCEDLEEEEAVPAESSSPEAPPWTEGELGAELLIASLSAAIDVLGSTETTSICRDYLEPMRADATIRRVTVTGACLASAAPHGDVFVPAAVVPDKLATVGARIQVSMVQTSTGRSAFLALSAEEAEDDGWHTAGRRSKQSGGNRRGGGGKGSSGGASRPQHRK